MIPACSKCKRSTESCQWCEHETESDWIAICDCGLLDFGAHLHDCEALEEFRYVVASSHEAAELPRPRFIVGSVTGAYLDPAAAESHGGGKRPKLPTSFYVYDRANACRVVAKFEAPQYAQKGTNDEVRRQAAEAACAEYNERDRANDREAAR